MWSADIRCPTEVSRWAIAAWASRTWAFDSANFLPPLRPRACGREPGQGAFADQLPPELGQPREDAEHEAAGRGGGVDLRAFTGEHPQAHAAGRLGGLLSGGSDGTSTGVRYPRRASWSASPSCRRSGCSEDDGVKARFDHRRVGDRDRQVAGMELTEHWAAHRDP